MGLESGDRDGPLPWEEREIDAAGAGAGHIGGRAGDESVDPAERPLFEGGEGVAEGFEVAEEDLIVAAETGEADLVSEPFDSEVEASAPRGTYAEADHQDSSERPGDDR